MDLCQVPPVQERLPRAAVAKDCTADRVMLSTHMKDHWQKIGYKPETDSLNEVDEAVELDIQVGRKNVETNVIPESTLSSKYHSVIVKGFRADTSWDSIGQILSQHGLPSDYNEESVIQNEKTGSISLENLNPVDCLTLISNMNRKRFLNRQIYVTSVVPVQKSLQFRTIFHPILERLWIGYLLHPVPTTWLLNSFSMNLQKVLLYKKQ